MPRQKVNMYLRNNELDGGTVEIIISRKMKNTRIPFPRIASLVDERKYFFRIKLVDSNSREKIIPVLSKIELRFFHSELIK